VQRLFRSEMLNQWFRRNPGLFPEDGRLLTEEFLFISVQRFLDRDPDQFHIGMTLFSYFKSSWRGPGQDLDL
jgi:hypothetical protein